MKRLPDGYVVSGKDGCNQTIKGCGKRLCLPNSRTRLDNKRPVYVSCGDTWGERDQGLWLCKKDIPANATLTEYGYYQV